MLVTEWEAWRFGPAAVRSLNHLIGKTFLRSHAVILIRQDSSSAQFLGIARRCRTAGRCEMPRRISLPPRKLSSKSGMAKAAALGKGLSALMGSAQQTRGAGTGGGKGRIDPPGFARRTSSRARSSRGKLSARRSWPSWSIRSRSAGIIQPLIVRLVNGKYELIAGERRWRAAGEAGLETLPVIVREASNRDVLELALIENLQRADLSPIEEAEAYARLMKEFSLTQEQVAQQVGKGRVVVANAVRLLTLPEQIRAWIGIGRPQRRPRQGAARARQRRGAVARRRAHPQGEPDRPRHGTPGRIDARRNEARPRNAKPPPPASEAIFADLEKRLQQHVGTRVRIVGKANAGKIEIQYFSPEDLDRILQLLRLPSA